MIEGQSSVGDRADYRLSHLSKAMDYDEALGRGNFDTYMADREREILEWVVPRLFPEGIPRYLDFACGTGRITLLLEPMAQEAYGVDVSESMIGQARRKCQRTTFLIQDLTQENLETGSFDLVSAFRFFGNAQDELRLSALRAIHHHLKAGGYLIINNHRNPWSIHNLMMRWTGVNDPVDLDRRKLRRLFAQSGFQIIRTYGIGFWMIRHRLNRPEVMGSRAVRLLEPLSRIRFVGPFCPDAVIVARRVG